MQIQTEEALQQFLERNGSRLAFSLADRCPEWSPRGDERCSLAKGHFGPHFAHRDDQSVARQIALSVAQAKSLLTGISEPAPEPPSRPRGKPKQKFDTVAALRGVRRRRRTAKRWRKTPAGGPLFVEGIGWLNEREAAAFRDDEAVLNDYGTSSGSWCECDWDARFVDEAVFAAPFNYGNGVKSVVHWEGFERRPHRVPWVDDH